MSAQHWENVQREQFLGELSYGVPFDVERYAQDGSFISINAALDFDWCRERLADLWHLVDPSIPGVRPTPRPAILWQVSCVFVHFAKVSADSRWDRYQQVMGRHLLLDDDGEPIPYPGEAPHYFAFDPESPGVWEAMLEFWDSEFRGQLFGDLPPGSIVFPGSNPCGFFFDNANDLIARKWETMGVMGQDFVRKRLAWKEGRTWLVKELRKRWGESIVLVLNWGKDVSAMPWDMIGDLNGLTIEGNPTSLKQRAMISMQVLRCLTKRRRIYVGSWNEKSRPLPFIPIGSHWAERSAGG